MLALLISYLFASGVGQCLVDYYEPRLKPIHYGICQPQSLRGPASTRPLEPVKPKLSLDPLADKDPKMRRVMRFLKNPNAQSLDINGDGQNDVIISVNKKGYRKVAVSFAKNGKINQSSVYDPQGRLIRERIDQDMDGQVNYLYECKDEKVCEARHFSATDTIERMIQTIHSDTEEVVRVYEDQNGQLKLVKKSKHPKVSVAFDQGAVPPGEETEGGFIPVCGDECYKKNQALDELLANLNVGGESNPNILPDDPNSDFRELPIRAGILIHDECFENPRLNELGGIQAAVEETIAKFAACQADIRDWQPNGAAQRSHIPEMMNVLDGGVDWISDRYTGSNGAIRSVQNACEDIRNFEFYENMDIQNCQDQRDYKNEKLKVFCQLDQYNVASLEHEGHDLTSDDTHSTAVGSRHGMAFVNWRGSTKVYNGPYIGVNPERRVSKGELISTLGHEFIHTLYPHNTHHHSYHLNDFATMCEASCFYDDWSHDKITGGEIEEAFHSCNSTETPDWNTRDTAQQIREKL